MAKYSSGLFNSSFEVNNLESMSVHHNNVIIDNLHVDDFVYLEKDLEFHDKVSLIFLLYGDNPLNAKIGLQRLLILYQSQQSQTTDIQKWIVSQKDENWRFTIIEALWTIKAKYALQKLGLDMDDLRVRFLNPANAEVNLNIHPVLKALYCICEQIDLGEAKQLINHVISAVGGKYQLNFTDEKYLEVFLLHWLSELVIEAGEWSVVQSKRNIFCKLDVILQFLNANKPELAEQLKRVIIRFNFTSNNVTSIERKANVTDDDTDRTDDKGNNNASEYHTSKSQTNVQNGTDDRYRVERDSAGFVLIINQIEFHRDPIKKTHLPIKPLEKRHGTNKDKKALNRTFSAVGYEIVEKENLTDTEILKEVKDIVAKSGSKDSLIVCILSHGSEGMIYGCNSVPVKIKEIQDIIVSKEMLNKPKILILQSCQGDVTQIAQPVENSLTDSKNLAHDGLPSKNNMIRCDICVAKSTIPGFSSIRHVKEGSWFIQTLCSTINNESDRKHFLDIMTMVKRQVTALRGDNHECMVPICEDTFTRDFYFPSKTIH